MEETLITLRMLAAWMLGIVLGAAPRFYVLLTTLEVPSEALLHPQKLKLFGAQSVSVVRHIPHHKQTTNKH